MMLRNAPFRGLGIRSLASPSLARISPASLARHYSPVRSKVPTPMRPNLRPNRRKARSLEAIESFEKPAVNYTDANISMDTGNTQSLAFLQTLLSQPSIVMERQLELMNIFLGFEQANKYTLYTTEGQTLGYMEECDLSIMKTITRQFTRLHRPFNVKVYDSFGQHCLTIKRPFSFINSRIKCILPEFAEDDPNGLLGETRQEWHLYRRRYNLFEFENDLQDPENSEMNQFGRVDAGFLSFNFPVQDKDEQLLASVDRNWVGLAREFFSDTGVYVLRFDPRTMQDMDGTLANKTLTLEQRAVLLATAVSIDFDYFSRHSRSHQEF